MFFQFYFQNGCPAPKELKEQCLSRINQLFNGSNGLQVHGQISAFSGFLLHLCRKINLGFILPPIVDSSNSFLNFVMQNLNKSQRNYASCRRSFPLHFSER